MTLRDILYPLAFVLLVGWMQQRDEAARPQVAPVRTGCGCNERDYLGRSLIASYCARSDLIQTKRCTYRRIAT